MSRKRLRIGLTATGGDMVASAMRALAQNQEIDFYIHAFNAEYNELSALIADRFSILPSGSDPNYLSTVIKHVKDNELQVLMPWSDEEAITLSQAREDLAKIGCVVLVSPPDVIQAITDKSKTYERISKAGLQVPEYTVVSKPGDIHHAVKFYGFPQRTVVIKPAAGRGGRGVNVLLGWDDPPDWLGSGRRERRSRSFDMVNTELESDTAYLVMPRLHAPVYDVDIFRFNQLTCKCFVRERNNPTGIPYTGNILRESAEISEYARNIASIMKLESLHDIDMMTDPIHGPVLLEINPRPSGSLAALNSAGYRLLDYALAGAAGLQIEIDDVRKDKRIQTYLESIAFS